MTLYEAGNNSTIHDLYASDCSLRVYAGIDAHGDVIYEAPHRPVTTRDVRGTQQVYYGGHRSFGGWRDLSGGEYRQRATTP